jgi:hypothetical protein
VIVGWRNKARRGTNKIDGILPVFGLGHGKKLIVDHLKNEKEKKKVRGMDGMLSFCAGPPQRDVLCMCIV